jgi:hypothetical protein
MQIANFKLTDDANNMTSTTTHAARTAARPLSATAANQLPSAPFDFAELRALAIETAGELPPRAVLWLIEEYDARQREIAALVSECQDRFDKCDRLREQLEAAQLRLRTNAQEAGAAERHRARLEAAARMTC